MLHVQNFENLPNLASATRDALKLFPREAFRKALAEGRAVTLKAAGWPPGAAALGAFEWTDRLLALADAVGGER